MTGLDVAVDNLISPVNPLPSLFDFFPTPGDVPTPILG
jgi:hypothetical protein